MVVEKVEESVEHLKLVTFFGFSLSIVGTRRCTLCRFKEMQINRSSQSMTCSGWMQRNTDVDGGCWEWRSGEDNTRGDRDVG